VSVENRKRRSSGLPGSKDVEQIKRRKQPRDHARVDPQRECCKLEENMVEHELRNRWKRIYLGKLELNRTPLSLQHSSDTPKRFAALRVASEALVTSEEATMPIATIQITREETTLEQKTALIKGAADLLVDALHKARC
jgi:hypothetical protein